MKYLRMYVGEAGESRVEELEATLAPLVYAPPAPALDISDPTDATRFVMVRFAPDWFGDFHPTPRRQLFIMLSGDVEGGLSDGTFFRVTTGDVLLMGDTTGKGHSTRVLNGKEVRAIMVHLE